MRTLQRELDDEGLSFTDLLSEVRFDLAQRYVGDLDYSIGQIAAMLGYSSYSSFTLWLTARFGCAPDVWRNEYGRLQRGVGKGSSKTRSS